MTNVRRWEVWEEKQNKVTGTRNAQGKETVILNKTTKASITENVAMWTKVFRD